MSGLAAVLADSRVLLVAYGVAETAAGIALLALPRGPGDDRFVRFWPLLAAHLLIHSAGDFWAAASPIPSETAASVAFELTGLSYLPLFEFGRRLLASRWPLPPATRWGLSLLVAIVVGVAALSGDPRVVSNPLIGYLIRFPGGLMTAVGLIALAGDAGFGRGLSRLCMSAGVTALLWAVACGLVRPEADFFPANWINEDTFQSVVGAPVIVFRLLLATTTVGLVVAIGRSIGAHRLALLQESEARYRAIAESASDAIITADSAGNIVGWNRAAASIFGYTKAEIEGQPLTVLMPRRYRERHLAGMRRVREGGEPRAIGKNLELEGRRKDASTFPLELSLATWESGQGSFVTGIIRDISERKLAADESRTVLRTAMDGFWIVDRQGRVLEVNEAYCRLIGYARDELLLMKISDIEAAESAPATAAHIDTIVRTGSDCFMTRHRRKDGAMLDIEVSCTYLPLKDGRIVAFLRDVTDRVQAEAALRLQGAALDAAANAIVITDRNGTIAWINSAFTALTGYGAAEAIGRNPRDLVKSGVHDRAFYKHLWDTILGGDVWHGEITNRRKDGSLYPETETITPVKDARGEVTHFIAIKWDRTEQKQLEAQFLQAQKMESVGRLAGGIAHDFNNLLTVINGTAELASTKLRDGDPLREDFLQIHRAVERAAALTRQLLAFSRKQILKPDVLNLSALVAEMEAMLRRLIGEDIDLVVVPAKDVGHVLADSGQIEQVIMNLAVNARDAMPEGGTLTIEARDVELDEAFAAEHPSVQPGPHVMLAVSDTGVGMDEATRMRIFEPFFTTKEPGKGTGLGLATVYGIVKQSGGSIRVSSEPGKGAAFRIYLPRVDDVPHTNRPARTRTAETGSETILVIEDDEAVRHVATRILKLAGYSVLAAGNGGEALQLLGRHDGPVHLMLTDVLMPGISGRDLVTRIADAHPQIKVLYTSGHTADVLRHGVLDGVTHFVGKPYTPAQLKRKVRAVLDA